MSSIFTAFSVGLGNGTRPRDFKLADVENIKEAIDGAWEPEPKLVGVTLAEGVEASEVATALRNEHCFILVSENETFESDEDGDQDDQDNELDQENEDDLDDQDNEPDLSKIKIKDTTLSTKVKESLEKAGFETLQDLFKYGLKHEGKFQGLESIDEYQEKKIIKILNHYYQ